MTDSNQHNGTPPTSMSLAPGQVEEVTQKIDVSIQESPTSVTFTFEVPPEFESIGSLFQFLRDAYSQFHNGTFLMVKYAARVSCHNMPVIQDPHLLLILLDPLQPYRDPLIEVQNQLTITLFKMPSKPFFYRKKVRPISVNKKPLAGS